MDTIKVPHEPRIMTDVGGYPVATRIKNFGSATFVTCSVNIGITTIDWSVQVRGGNFAGAQRLAVRMIVDALKQLDDEASEA